MSISTINEELPGRNSDPAVESLSKYAENQSRIGYYILEADGIRVADLDRLAHNAEELIWVRKAKVFAHRC